MLRYMSTQRFDGSVQDVVTAILDRVSDVKLVDVTKVTHCRYIPDVELRHRFDFNFDSASQRWAVYYTGDAQLEWANLVASTSAGSRVEFQGVQLVFDTRFWLDTRHQFTFQKRIM